MTTLHQYLTTFHEAMPGWLTAYCPAARSLSEIIGDFMRSRLVYYPGSGNDGHPIAAFNRAHAAHCYIYVDYLTDRATLLNQLQATGFVGYHSLDRVDISEIVLGRGRWTPHASPQRYPFTPVRPYAFLEIMERDAARSDDHGAERFAILFLAADGHAAFDALFCQNDGILEPFCTVIQDHGFGGGYSPFGHGGLMHDVAKVCNVFPRFMLVGENSRAWDDYVKCLDKAGLELQEDFSGDWVDGARLPGHPRHLRERVLDPQ